VGVGGAEPECETPPNLADPAAIVAPGYADHYKVYDLGPVPGVLDPLGGTVIKHDDTDVLLIAGESERPQAKLYTIGLNRGPCGHILSFEGEAQEVAQTPYVDANLVYTDANLLFYSQWPQFKLNQLLPGSTTPDHETDLRDFGMIVENDQGPGGMGFVPFGPAAGTLRMVSWPAGHWYQVSLEANGALFDVTGLVQKTQLSNNPGGFAYVPAGSPGFPESRIIVTEWIDGLDAEDGAQDRVATYAIDDEGDPLPDTREEFLVAIHRPWGSYFEPVTGDFLFLQWEIGGPLKPPDEPDRVYIVQGFVPPPPVVVK